MKKAWWLLLLLLLSASASAYSISDWPKFFVKDNKFSAQYVVGDEAPALDVVSATVISTSLAKFENVTVEVGTSTLDSEIVDITSRNAIVIGSPCTMIAASKLMGDPNPCYKDLGGSVGYIKLYENNGKVQLLITGLDEKDRSAAAKYLANRNLKDIATNEYIVPSNSGSLPTFIEQRLKAKNVTKNVTVSNFTVPSDITEPPQVNVSLPKVEPKKVEIDKYEPLTEIPKAEEKGWWASFWDWLMSLFT